MVISKVTPVHWVSREHLLCSSVSSRHACSCTARDLTLTFSYTLLTARRTRRG